MFLRSIIRNKNGKEHRYWSVVENRRVGRKRVVQKTLLYLGEINDSQQAGWTHALEAVDGNTSRQLSLFPDDRQPPKGCDAVQVKMREFELLHPRQWGGCWLALELWNQLQLDDFWAPRLPPSREGTDWLGVLKTLSVYRLLEPGSEWRLHRHWFERTALADLLGGNFGLAAKDALYRCLDRLLAHKQALFTHMKDRWQDLFNARYEVLLYDLTSTYFESNPPFPATDKRHFGYSRDKRSDCVQVVIALIVTPEGFPLAYEVFSGNTTDKSTLRDFLKKIETQYGKAQRVWVMDRGVPTEEVLEEMRKSDPQVQYLVGTPKGRLTQMEQDLLKQPWQSVRPGVAVKLLTRGDEVYVLAESRDRVNKERSMRRLQMKRLWKRLHELQKMNLSHDQLLMKLGAAQQQWPAASRLVDAVVCDGKIKFNLKMDKLRSAYRREGRYLLRSNMKSEDPADLWRMYIQLVHVEEAFRNLKGDLSVRPIYHQREDRIEAHIFVSFIAYCLHVTLSQRLKVHAAGLTPRSVLEQLNAMQMLDVRIPTTDGRWLHMCRYTQPDKLQQLLINQMKMQLPEQSPPEITMEKARQQWLCSEDLQC